MLSPEGECDGADGDHSGVERDVHGPWADGEDNLDAAVGEPVSEAGHVDHRQDGGDEGEKSAIFRHMLVVDAVGGGLFDSVQRVDCRSLKTALENGGQPTAN